MESQPSDILSVIEEGDRRTLGILERLFSAAHTSAVYGQPIQQGQYTVITASEIAAGGGFGFGRGVGPSTSGAAATGETPKPVGGSGGGGGGGSTARPVATIIIGPDGVKVEPVVDVTKIVLAALTTWAAMLPVIIGIRRARQGH